MARLDIVSVEGFQDLNRKLRQLPDKVKRTEILKIQRQLSKPIQRAYAGNLPKDQGTLSKSVAIRAVSVRRSKGNPTVQVLPGKRGKNNAFYRFAVIPKGARPNGNKRGSRRGLNTVVPSARDKTIQQVETGVVEQGSKKIGAYVQKLINKLSR